MTALKLSTPMIANLAWALVMKLNAIINTRLPMLETEISELTKIAVQWPLLTGRLEAGAVCT